MCKVLAITNLKNVKVDQKLISVINKALTKNDKDGFGYAVLMEDGNMAGERTLDPGKFNPLKAAKESRTLSLPIVQKTRNSFGKLQFDGAKSLIAHGRMSTNSIHIDNTHPFVDKDVAMVHNGVVDDASDLVKDGELKTDCDTELLFKHWCMGGMEQVEKWITGYYAFCVLDRATGFLHVVRDAQATLHLTYCRTIDSFIIATTPEILYKIAHGMKWAIEKPEPIIENTAATFDRNEIIENITILPKGWGDTIDHSLAERALGGAKVYSTKDGEMSYKAYDDDYYDDERYPTIDRHGYIKKA